MDKKKLKYKEPDNYIPKEIWDKYFNEDGSVKEKTEEKKEEKKKPADKKKK